MILNELRMRSVKEWCSVEGFQLDVLQMMMMVGRHIRCCIRAYRHMAFRYLSSNDYDEQQSMCKTNLSIYTTPPPLFWVPKRPVCGEQELCHLLTSPLFSL
jgi:hypothetical protein